MSSDGSVRCSTCRSSSCCPRTASRQIARRSSACFPERRRRDFWGRLLQLRRLAWASVQQSPPSIGARGRRWSRSHANIYGRGLPLEVASPGHPVRPMSALTKISEHVYWMSPGPPDRPSVCAVKGARRTLMLDAGSSRAHTRQFLEGLAQEHVARPNAVVYTHSHWDHVLGGSELDGMVIAHALTAELLIELAARDWSDEGLDGRVAAGQSSAQHAEHVKAELPSPRTVEVVPADIVFRESLDIEL